MGVFDEVLTEAEGRLGLSSSKASTLLSGFLSLVNEQTDGLRGLLDRFRLAGLGSWLSGGAKAIPTENLESALGTDTIQSLANKSGLSFVAASSALAFMIPKVVQRLAPGGVAPNRLPSDVMSYVTRPTAAIASGTRQAVQATERGVRSSAVPRFLWPLLVLVPCS